MSSKKAPKNEADAGSPPPEMEVHQQPTEPLLTEPVPPTTGAIAQAHETLNRLSENLRKEDAQFRHHIHQLRVVFADGSSQLVEATADGKIHIIEQRNLDNSVSPVKGSDVLNIAAYIETVKSNRTLWEAEQRKERRDSEIPPVESPPPPRDRRPR